MNNVTLIGNIAAKPELRYTAQQTPVASFSMATNKKTKNGDTVTWHQIIVWKTTAENCAKYLDKGSKVAIRGEIATRTWDDQEGVKRYKTEITAHEVEFLSGIKTDSKFNKPDMQPAMEQTPLDDMPF